MSIFKVFLPLFVVCWLSSCADSSGEEGQTDPRSKKHLADDNSDNDQDDAGSCGVEDGTHAAAVDYYNPNTGYTATYALQVEVDNCQVTQINFNNGGYLDGDHIDPADLDENGNASVEDDRNRTFDVHVRK